MDKIQNEYYFTQSKLFIQTHLISSKTMTIPIKENLITLYNQITIDNGLESLDKAKQLVEEINTNNLIDLNSWFKNILIILLICGLILFSTKYTLIFGAYYDRYIKPILYSVVLMELVWLCIYSILYVGIFAHI